jgi:hypothetical protein
MGLGIMKRWD